MRALFKLMASYDDSKQESDWLPEKVMHMADSIRQTTCDSCVIGNSPCKRCQQNKEIALGQRFNTEAGRFVSDDFFHDIDQSRPLDSVTWR